MKNRPALVLASLLPLVSLLPLAPRSASACAMKSNAVTIVLGVVGDEVVSVRISLHEDDTATLGATEWSGSATLHVGALASAVGAIDPRATASAEVDRLIGLARAAAQQLGGFVEAKRLSAKDCSEHPKPRCGGVSLKKAGTQLAVGALRVPLAVTMPSLDAADLAIIGVVRYRAGTTEIAVVNVGGGDPRFSTSVSTCDGGPCREITTLHHGEQSDVVVVTAR